MLLDHHQAAVVEEVVTLLTSFLAKTMTILPLFHPVLLLGLAPVRVVNAQHVDAPSAFAVVRSRVRPDDRDIMTKLFGCVYGCVL